MSKRKHLKITVCLLVVSILLLCMYADCLCAASKDGSVDVGRTNPFAKIDIARKPIPQVVIKSPQTSEEAPGLFLESITLKFLNAKNLKPIVDKMVSEFGSVSVDEKTNSLIVCEAREKLDEILAEVKKIDKTPPQIMVEVVILDVQLDNDTEMGINWDLLSNSQHAVSYRQNFTTSRIGSTPADDTSIGNATAFNSTGLGGDVSVVNQTIRNVVHLIQEKNSSQILASPRVMMVSGQSANIEAVEELPYTELTGTAQGGAQALTSTQFKLVGVKLNVEATLVDGNSIFLTVEAEQNVAVGQSTTNVPIVDTRKAKSALLLKQGQVVVFGGLRRQDKTKQTNQIPLIGDLPIIGALFRSTQEVIQNSELIVFLSPHVYSQEPPAGAQAMAKFDEITKRPLLEYPDDAAKSPSRKSDK